MTVVRFEPNPNGPLHLGHARLAILNDEFRKKNNGKFILRFGDTNPKKVLPEAYEMIKEDLEWLGIKIDEIVYQSDRLELYYSVIKELIKKGYAYTCEGLPEEELIELRKRKEDPPDLKLSIDEHLERFEKMVKGEYSEGEIVVILRIDPNNPNPALREKNILRIIDTPHPRVGNKYKAWPTMNLAVAVDDYYLGITHVIRGKDHEMNTIIQQKIWEYMGWKREIQYIHIGRIHFTDLKLSTSQTLEKIKSNEYSGWDDPRTGFLRSFKRRGFHPEAIRKFVLNLGMKASDVHVSKENLYAENRKIIDPISPRRFFVQDPVIVEVYNFPEEIEFVELKNHPKVDLGKRKIKLTLDNGKLTLYMERKDIINGNNPENMFRIKDLCNVVIKEILEEKVITEFHSIDYKVAKEKKLPKYHWVFVDDAIKTKVLMEDGSIIEGYAESSIKDLNIGSTIQFERFAFVKIETISEDEVETIYTHS